MMNKKNLKPNRKPLYLLLGFFGVFGLLIYILTIKSTRTKGKEELAVCFNVDDVKKCWDKYKSKLYQDEEFVEETRLKLSSFNLPDSQISSIKNWLPKPPQSLNVIVVPDLSRRIIDPYNNPEQIKNDTMLLNYVWQVFKEAVKGKTDSKDRLLVDITDGGQAGRKFRLIADSMIFDLSKHHGKVNTLYFKQQGHKYEDNIDSLYKFAKVPLGADYREYFCHNLRQHIKANTLFDDYRNVMIIVTDGYLESQQTLYTGNLTLHNEMCRLLKSGQSLDEIFTAKKLKIAPCDVDLSNLEVLILEVNERQVGTGCHFDVLKKCWKEWFHAMKVKNTDDNFFIKRNDASGLTKDIIKEFITK
jgi:hypothetical protein